MSKEKECKCCHEWWYGSEIKNDLCPNCYDYFKQLKQQLDEKDKEIAHLKEKDNYHLRYELAGADETITNLKQQLAEKQNTINEINKEFVQAVHDWKALCAEKDKEIEKLKQQYTILENENGKLTTELIMDKYKKAQKEVSFGKQLAIQELEKLRNDIWELDIGDYYFQNGGILENIKIKRADVLKLIDQQIKELKGE